MRVSRTVHEESNKLYLSAPSTVCSFLSGPMIMDLIASTPTQTRQHMLSRNHLSISMHARLHHVVKVRLAIGDLLGAILAKHLRLVLLRLGPLHHLLLGRG